MTVKFIIPGDPQGKGRHRSTRTGVQYTPKKTQSYENLVKGIYQLECKGIKLDGELKMSIRAYMYIPTSASKKKRASMIAGELRPTKKPDLDNMAKIVADSLNRIAYDDDSQIVEMNVSKFFSENPRVEVEISNL